MQFTSWSDLKILSEIKLDKTSPDLVRIFGMNESVT